MWLRPNVIVSVFLVAPIVKAEKQMVASPYGTQVVLECLVQASPLAINLWYKDGNYVLFNQIASSNSMGILRDV